MISYQESDFQKSLRYILKEIIVEKKNKEKEGLAFYIKNRLEEVLEAYEKETEYYYNSLLYHNPIKIIKTL